MNGIMRHARLKPSRYTGAMLMVWLVGMAQPAHAELVFFSTGRSMSVKSVKADGDSLTLTLRTGGEIVCERSVIARIEPDEVPYPEPVVEAPPLQAALAPVLPPVPYGDIIDRVSAEQNVPA